MCSFCNNLFLLRIFFIILAEIGKENKDHSQMIYRFFKFYFSEKEKILENEIRRGEERINNYKSFIKNVIHTKVKDQKIDDIMDILFRNNLTQDNLDNHKKSLNFVLSLLNDQREANYMLTSEYEILNKEMNFWIADFDKLKAQKELRVIIELLKINYTLLTYFTYLLNFLY